MPVTPAAGDWNRREARAAESDLDSEGKMDWGYSLVVVHLPSVTEVHVQALGTAEEDQ